MLLQILTLLNRLQNCNSTSFPSWYCLCRPKNGGKYCVGRRMKFKSCNTEPCSKLKKDFRDEQCAEFDGKHFNINGLPTNVRWVPKYSGSKCLGGMQLLPPGLLPRGEGVQITCSWCPSLPRSPDEGSLQAVLPGGGEHGLLPAAGPRHRRDALRPRHRRHLRAGPLPGNHCPSSSPKGPWQFCRAAWYFCTMLLAVVGMVSSLRGCQQHLQTL